MKLLKSGQGTSVGPACAPIAQGNACGASYIALITSGKPGHADERAFHQAVSRSSPNSEGQLKPSARTSKAIAGFFSRRKANEIGLVLLDPRILTAPSSDQVKSMRS